MTITFALLAALAASAPTLQFDLVCHGDEAVFSTAKRWGQEPFVERIHVDLVNGLFCSDACAQLRRAHRVTPTEYALLDAHDGGRHWEKKIVQRVPFNEEAGYVWTDEGQNIWRKGACRVATFTPFPAGTPTARAINDPVKPWVPPQ